MPSNACDVGGGAGVWGVAPATLRVLLDAIAKVARSLGEKPMDRVGTEDKDDAKNAAGR